MKTATDIVNARGLIAGGLSADSSKDVRMRLALDMLGVKYKYVTGYRSSAPARLAFQRGEINIFAESTPSYRSIVVPDLIDRGQAIPLWYDAGDFAKPSSQMAGLPILPFPALYRKIKGAPPSGPLWDNYRAINVIDGAMLRMICFPPGTPPAAREALAAAIVALNADKDHAAEAMRTIGFVPEWQAGPDVQQAVQIDAVDARRCAQLSQRLYQGGEQIAQRRSLSASQAARSRMSMAKKKKTTPLRKPKTAEPAGRAHPARARRPRAVEQSRAPRSLCAADLAHAGARRPLRRAEAIDPHRHELSLLRRRRVLIYGEAEARHVRRSSPLPRTTGAEQINPFRRAVLFTSPWRGEADCAQAQSGGGDSIDGCSCERPCAHPTPRAFGARPSPSRGG